MWHILFERHFLYSVSSPYTLLARTVCFPLIQSEYVFSRTSILRKPRCWTASWSSVIRKRHTHLGKHRKIFCSRITNYRYIAWSHRCFASINQDFRPSFGIRVPKIGLVYTLSLRGEISTVLCFCMRTSFLCVYFSSVGEQSHVSASCCRRCDVERQL